MPPTDTLQARRVGTDLLELIAQLQDSLADAWREIQDLRERVVSLSPVIEPLTVEQMVKRHPALTAGGIRWMLFHREANGLERSKAIITRGRRIYLDEARFLEWFASQERRGSSLRRNRGGA
jgi:hypothetical protein